MSRVLLKSTLDTFSENILVKLLPQNILTSQNFDHPAKEVLPASWVSKANLVFFHDHLFWKGSDSFAYNVKKHERIYSEIFPSVPVTQSPSPQPLFFLLPSYTYFQKYLRHTGKFICTEHYLYVMYNYICLLVWIRNSGPGVPIRITWETFRQGVCLHPIKTSVFVLALDCLVCFLVEKHEPEI